MSCVAAPATCSAPCYSPVSYASTTEQQCTFTHPSHRQHVAYTSHYSGCFSYLVLDPNMTHCLHQQPLAQTARTPHLHKPELPGSSLSPFFNLLARSYIQANTGFPLFGRCRNSEWFLSFGPTHTPRNSLHSGECCHCRVPVAGMPKPNPFPSGPIRVSDQHLLDMSAGMN